MLVPAKPRRLDQPIAVSLEQLVPPNHFYRHLEAKLNLSFVRDWPQELHAERGWPSIDPVIFFKLQLIMFFEGIRSERQLIATASLNLAHRATEVYQKAMRKRQLWVATQRVPGFAEGKAWHGLRRLR